MRWTEVSSTKHEPAADELAMSGAECAEILDWVALIYRDRPALTVGIAEIRATRALVALDRAIKTLRGT